MNSQAGQGPFGIIEQQEQEQQSQSSFYTQLFKKQQEYRFTNSETALEQLIKHYSDCIQYFDMHGEGVSTYFQHKLKKLMLHKRKIDKSSGIEKQLQHKALHTPITQQIKDHRQSATKYQQKITSIIDKQKQILAERRLIRKPMSLTSGFSASMDSLFQSPQNKSIKSSISPFKTKLFDSLINDDDQEEEQKLSN